MTERLADHPEVVPRVEAASTTAAIASLGSPDAAIGALRRVLGLVTPEVLQGARWAAVTLWAGAFATLAWRDGIPWFRTDLILWLATGVAAASIGKRVVWQVVVDFLPLALVLIVYDELRGISDTLGMPTWWHPQVDIDGWIFAGHQPTVWLQEHLKDGSAQWWDVAVSLCYVSFFFLPYVTAAVLWLRSRRDFYRWTLRFVALSFVGFACFALAPAAPPWAAAACTASQVATHPHAPACLDEFAGAVPHGGLLGSFTTHQPGAYPWVERIALRGLDVLHLRFASAIVSAGQGGVDLVAAIPSLHAGGIALFSLFMWRRVNPWWRPALVLYPLLMGFSLVYSGEHFVADVLAGWLAAGLVAGGAVLIERRGVSRVQRLAPHRYHCESSGMAYHSLACR